MTPPSTAPAVARGAPLRAAVEEAAQYLVHGPLLRIPEELKLDRDARILVLAPGSGALARALDRRIGFVAAPVAHDPLPAGDAPLPCADGAFTVVLCGSIAHRLDDGPLRALLGEVHRVLAPGGLAVIWDFGPSGHRPLDAWNARVLALAGGGAPRLRSAATLRAAAAAAGFAFTRDARLRPFLAPPIPRAAVLVGRPPEDWTGDAP